MFKKLILFSTIAVLGGCETINQASQCDPAKNYVTSNPNAMEEYKFLKKTGKVNSYFYYKTPTGKCLDTLCVMYNPSKIKYYEKFFDDEERKGVYTIAAIENIDDGNCMKEPSYTVNKDRICYSVIKNKGGQINSRYEYIYDKTKKGQTIISFYDREKDIKLYEYSYQIYSTKVLGGPGFGTCKPSDNNPNYKFNAVSFPIDD